MEIRSIKQSRGKLSTCVKLHYVNCVSKNNIKFTSDDQQLPWHDVNIHLLFKFKNQSHRLIRLIWNWKKRINMYIVLSLLDDAVSPGFLALWIKYGCQLLWHDHCAVYGTFVVATFNEYKIGASTAMPTVPNLNLLLVRVISSRQYGGAAMKPARRTG